jgi:aspartyl-tRNA(Asn)/glutamyl-tRNA(Gln) amidotransferase subunit A
VPEGKVSIDLDIAARVWHVVSRTGVAWLMAKNPTYEKLGAASARAMAPLESVSAIRWLVAELFEGLDLVLTPTAAAPPALPELDAAL